MIRFDPHTRSSWKEANISEISCIVTNTGCAGHKIRIEIGKSEGLEGTIEGEGVRVHVAREYEGLLRGAYISHVKGNWILASDTVNTRCGCGKSFSLKSGNTTKDKIARMKLLLKQKKEGIHT